MPIDIRFSLLSEDLNVITMTSERMNPNQLNYTLNPGIYYIEVTPYLAESSWTFEASYSLTLVITGSITTGVMFLTYPVQISATSQQSKFCELVHNLESSSNLNVILPASLATSIVVIILLLVIVVLIVIRQRRSKRTSKVDPIETYKTPAEESPYGPVGDTTLATSPGSINNYDVKIEKSFEIDYNELTGLIMVGKGFFGVVYKGKWREIDVGKDFIYFS